MTKHFLFLLGLFTLVGCENNRYFEANKSYEKGVWEYSDPASFDFDVSDTEQPFDLMFTLRNETKYSYNNIWIFVAYTAPSGKAFTDTVECPLAYPNGQWIGSGIGDMVDSKIVFRSGYKFKEKGMHNITFTHGMRQEALSPIYDVGLRLEYTNGSE